MTGRAAGLGFAFHQGRTVVADFSVGQLTSNAVRRTDHLPLRELDHRLGWSKTAAKLLTDSRGRVSVTRQTTVLLRQHLFVLIAGGYADASEHTRVRISPV
jgi:hypothetical protein